MPHILIADDDRVLCGLLSDYLSGHGFTVDVVHNGEDAVRAVRERAHDALVLDVTMPGADGFEILKALRPEYAIPVLMLTARGEDVDRIVGLELGADDYLPKPCNPRELLARLRAILRRIGGESRPASQALVCGDLALSPAARTATLDGTPLDLTGAEFEVLQVLLEDAGHVVTKDAIARRALGRPLARFDRSVDVHVSRLRSKLGAHADGSPRIQAVRGRGYLYVMTSRDERRER
jgi:DNA-binding response OmpR family regulator